MTKAVNPKNQALWQLPDLYSFLCEWAYEVYDQEKHPALGQSPREAWESGLDLGGPREHRRIRYDDAFRVLTLPGSPRETALVYRNHGIQFHYLLYWNDVFASPGIIGTKVKLRFDPFDISHIYVYVHNHWVECITSSYYGQLHGHSEREIMLASAELREQNRESHVRTPIDAKRLADFLAKSASAHIEHKGGKWVFSELKNEPILSHFYCITSCLVAHCLFGRFFLAFFPLYSGGSDARLSHPR